MLKYRILAGLSMAITLLSDALNKAADFVTDASFDTHYKAQHEASKAIYAKRAKAAAAFKAARQKSEDMVEMALRAGDDAADTYSVHMQDIAMLERSIINRSLT